MLDHILVHTKDFGGPASVHPPSPYRVAEPYVGANWYSAPLILFRSRGLVHEIPTHEGFLWQAAEPAAPFVDCLTTKYHQLLRARAQWTIENFGEASDTQLASAMGERVVSAIGVEVTHDQCHAAINQLTYLGPNKLAVRVDLKPGLNIICGSSETGKSFIVETIDFMLGGGRKLRQLPERAGYDRAVMQITLSDDRKFTFQRSLDGGGFLWRAGHHDELEKIDETLKPTHNSDRDDNLSQRILSLLGWAAIVERTRKPRRSPSPSATSLTCRLSMKRASLTRLPLC